MQCWRTLRTNICMTTRREVDSCRCSKEAKHDLDREEWEWWGRGGERVRRVRANYVHIISDFHMIQTRTRTHSHMHAQSLHTNTNTCTLTHTRTHAHTHTYTHTHTHTYMHTSVPDLPNTGGEPGPGCLHGIGEVLPTLQELLLLLRDAGPVVGEEGEVDHV